MTNRRQILASIAAASSGTLLDMLSRPARAQTIQKLTHIIIGTPPGGYPDTVARLLINHMKSYASTIILENKPGAGQRIALEALKNSVADGSTMMLSPAGPNVLYPHIYKTLSYKPFEDFIPVTTVFDTPSAFVVGPMVPPQVKTVADFVGWCRANSTKSAYGTPGAGTPMHFLGVMLATAGGVTYLPRSLPGFRPSGAGRVEWPNSLSDRTGSCCCSTKGAGPSKGACDHRARTKRIAPGRSHHEGGRFSGSGVLRVVRHSTPGKNSYGHCNRTQRSGSQRYEHR